MQNLSLDPINIQHKCSVIIKKPKYYMNDGWSWIISSIESGKLTENSTIDDIFKLKTELVDKNKKRLNQFLRSDNNKNGVLIDPCNYCIDVPYYVIGDNLDKLNIEERNYIENNLNIVNDRLMSCTVSQDISGDGTCSFVLNNTGDIYTLNNEITNIDAYGEYFLDQANTCIIEPNDEVEVFMSDWAGKLNLVFTGLVTNVNLSDNGLNKTVNVQCNNMKKKLTWHYFNAQASWDIKEARGVAVSLYAENQQHRKLNEVISLILAETYSDIYRRDDFLLKLVKIYANAYKTGLKLASQQALLNMNNTILEELNKYIKIEYDYRLVEVMGKTQIVPINKEAGRVGYKCTIDYESLMALNTSSKNTYIRTPLLDYQAGDLAFKIEGTNQVAWSYTTHNGTYDYLFSNYKRSDEVINTAAGLVQYEFFANENGIIRFRPPNLILPYVFTTNQETNNIVKDNYWITKDKEQYIINQNTSKNDSNVYTRINVSGHHVEFSITNDFMKRAAYAPQEYLNKYGLRMMQSVNKAGLVDEEGLISYGELLLTKNNINYELSTLNLILNSNLRIGNPIFINNQLAIWYIGRVVHNFTAGAQCTTTLTLTYKRTPICIFKDVDKYVQDNRIWGNLSNVDADYIKNNKQLLTWGRLVIKKEDENNDDYNLVWKPIICRLYDVLPQLMEFETNFDYDIKVSNNQVKRTRIIKNKVGATFGKDMKKNIDFEKARGQWGQDQRQMLAITNKEIDEDLKKSFKQANYLDPASYVELTKSILEWVGGKAYIHDQKCKIREEEWKYRKNVWKISDLTEGD